MRNDEVRARTSCAAAAADRRVRAHRAAVPEDRDIPGAHDVPGPRRALIERRRLRTRLIVEVGQRHPRQPVADRLLDVAQVALFLGRHERERRTGGIGARGPADAVNVVIGHVRHVEVHDVPERRDVDAASGNIGGHQHAILATLETGERFRRCDCDRFP